MGSSQTKPPSKKDARPEEKKSERTQVKSLEMLSPKILSDQDPGLDSKNDRNENVTDMERKRVWVNSQECKRSRDLMKMSEASIETKNELSVEERLEEKANVRRQRDKSVKQRLSQSVESRSRRRSRSSTSKSKRRGVHGGTQHSHVKASKPRRKRSSERHSIEAANPDETQEKCAEGAQN